LNQLSETGRGFTYSSFLHGDYNTIGAVLPEWRAWCTRTNNLIHAAFKPDSPQVNLVNSGTRRAGTIVGNGSEYFNETKKMLIAALTEAVRASDNDQFGELIGSTPSDAGPIDPKTIFVVHGHDEATKNEVELFLSEIGSEPVVLHRQADEGLTILAKFEKRSAVGFAIVLLTPDDAVCKADGTLIERRARQNVAFELGFFCGALGRNRVRCVYREGTALPSDISGLVYKPF